MKTAEQFNLAAKLIIIYLTLLAICFIFYALIVLPVTEADKVNAIVGLLGWSASIFAPIAAFILLDSWKHQKQYELKKEYISNIINEIRPIYLNILLMHSNALNIKTVDKNLVINSDYLDHKSKYISNSVLNIYSNFKVYAKLADNSKILELYDSLEMHAFFTDKTYQLLIKRYQNYFNSFTRDRDYLQNKDYSIFRDYYGKEKLDVMSDIFMIDNFFNQLHLHSKEYESHCSIMFYKHDELFKNTLKIIKEIQEICLDEFKP